MTNRNQIAAALRESESYCARCTWVNAGVSNEAQVRHLLKDMTERGQVSCQQGPCNFCGKGTRVFRLLPGRQVLRPLPRKPKGPLTAMERLLFSANTTTVPGSAERIDGGAITVSKRCAAPGCPRSRRVNRSQLNIPWRCQIHRRGT